VSAICLARVSASPPLSLTIAARSVARALPRRQPHCGARHPCAVMSAASARACAAPGRAVAPSSQHARPLPTPSAQRAARAAPALRVGSNGARFASAYSLRRSGLPPAAIRLRRRVAATASAPSGEPRPDFATKGEFKRDGTYALKYLYDGGACLGDARRRGLPRRGRQAPALLSPAGCYARRRGGGGDATSEQTPKRVTAGPGHVACRSAVRALTPPLRQAAPSARRW